MSRKILEFKTQTLFEISVLYPAIIEAETMTLYPGHIERLG